MSLDSSSASFGSLAEVNRPSSRRTSHRSSHRSSGRSSLDPDSFRMSLTDSTIDQTVYYHPASAWNPIASIQSSGFLNFVGPELESSAADLDVRYTRQDPPDAEEVYDLVPWEEAPSDNRLGESAGSGTTEELTDPLSEAEEEDFEPCEEHYRIPQADEEVPEQPQHKQPQELVCRSKHDPPDRPLLPTKDKLIEQINAQLALVPLPSSSHKYNGYRHNFITVKEQHRFLVLYNFLKRNISSKIIIYFSTTKSTQYHAKLLNRLKFDVKAAHNGQSKEKFLDEFLAFSKQKSGVLCLPDFQGNEFAIPPSVSWIVQYEPPGDPTEYIFRVGRISSERSGVGGGRALIFLTPNQFNFLDYFKAAHVKFYEYEIHKISNVQRQYERLVRKDDKLSKMGREAYHSYMISYASHDYRDVYDVHQLEKEMVARSFGFDEPPSIERDDKDRDREGKKLSTREENRWKPNKKELGDNWMNKEKIWKHADRHAHLMKCPRTRD
ncbi:hypothetical protein ACHAWX_002463 [Stephanocyclus meneghinianus]